MTSKPSKKPERSRLPLLLGLLLAVGALVWLDHRSRDRGGDSAPLRPSTRSSTRPAASARAPAVRSGAPRRPTPRAKRRPPGAANPLAGLRLAELRDTLARPLFEPRRRRFTPPKRPKPAPRRAPPKPRKAPPDPNAFTLLGIVTGENTAIALLQRKSNGRRLRVKKGDVIAGWRVARIETRRVVLHKQGVAVMLRLFRKRPTRGRDAQGKRGKWGKQGKQGKRRK